MNAAPQRLGSCRRIRVYWSKSLNNVVQQEHCAIRFQIRPVKGFKALLSAKVALDRGETAHLIRNGELGTGCSFTIYVRLAAQELRSLHRFGRDESLQQEPERRSQKLANQGFQLNSAAAPR